MQQPELVGVERFLDGIQNHVHLVVGMVFRHLVSGSDAAAVALFEVAGAPRAVQMMNRYAPLLCVNPRTEHLGRAEQHADSSGVHVGDHGLAGLLGGRLLYEPHLARRNAVVLHELALHLGIDVELRSTLLPLGKRNKFPLPSLNRRVPLYTAFVGSQIGEYELRTFLLVETTVVVRNHLSAVAGLVVHVVSV